MTKKIFIIFILNLISIEFVSSQNCNYEDYQKRIQLAKKECENENFNLEFRKTLLNLAELDTETNSHFHQWRTRKEEHSVDTLVAEMTNISLEFQKMIEKFGFPIEKKIGYYYNKGDVNELPTFVLFVHIYQRGELVYKERLNELVCIGSLTTSQSKQLESTRGFGNSTGIVQEMEARKNNYRKSE